VNQESFALFATRSTADRKAAMTKTRPTPRSPQGTRATAVSVPEDRTESRREVELHTVHRLPPPPRNRGPGPPSPGPPGGGPRDPRRIRAPEGARRAATCRAFRSPMRGMLAHAPQLAVSVRWTGRNISKIVRKRRFGRRGRTHGETVSRGQQAKLIRRELSRQTP